MNKGKKKHRGVTTKLDLCPYITSMCIYLHLCVLHLLRYYSKSVSIHPPFHRGRYI